MSGDGARRKQADRSDPRAGSALSLEAFLAYRLSRLAHRVTRALAQSYASDQMLTHSEWKILSIVAEHAPLSQKDVAVRSTLDRFAVSKSIARMKKRGLVETSPMPDDRRSIQLSLTADGWAVYDPIAREGLRQQEALFAGLDDAERRELFRLLDHLDTRVVAEFGSEGTDEAAAD